MNQLTVLPAQDVRKQLAELISKAHFANEPTVISRNGKNAAVLVSFEEFQQIQKLLNK